MTGDTFTCAAVVDHGTVRLLARPQMLAWAKRIGEGVALTVTISEKQDKRTNRQNRRHWAAFITPLAEHLGYDRHELEDLHESLLCLFTGTHQDKLTGREVPNKRSSSMTVAEFCEFDEWIARWAAKEHNCVLDLEAT